VPRKAARREREEGPAGAQVARRGLPRQWPRDLLALASDAERVGDLQRRVRKDARPAFDGARHRHGPEDGGEIRDLTTGRKPEPAAPGGFRPSIEREAFRLAHAGAAPHADAATIGARDSCSRV